MYLSIGIDMAVPKNYTILQAARATAEALNAYPAK